MSTNKNNKIVKLFVNKVIPVLNVEYKYYINTLIFLHSELYNGLGVYLTLSYINFNCLILLMLFQGLLR